MIYIAVVKPAIAGGDRGGASTIYAMWIPWVPQPEKTLRLPEVVGDQRQRRWGPTICLWVSWVPSRKNPSLPRKWWHGGGASPICLVDVPGFLKLVIKPEKMFVPRRRRKAKKAGGTFFTRMCISGLYDVSYTLYHNYYFCIRTSHRIRTSHHRISSQKDGTLANFFWVLSVHVQ